MSKVRWGIISTAKIGMEKVIPAMQQSQYCDITAIASRDLNKAKSASQKLGIPKAYGSYEELFQDPDIDAVYNPTPNHLHVPLSIQALEAGKHVLCEKPIGLSAAEGQTLVDAGKKHPRLKLMEAFMYRHHPQWLKAKSLVNEGKIGDLRTIQSFFSYYNADPSNVRNHLDMGGGGLLDIGCYNISLSRYIFNEEPKRVCGIVEFDPKFKTDRLASGMMEFSKGTSTFTCSMQLISYQRAIMFGTEGRVEIEIPFNAPPDRPCRMWHELGEGNTETIDIDTCDQYTIQGDLMSQAILNDTDVPTPIEDSVLNMNVIEAIFLSAKENRWVDL